MNSKSEIIKHKLSKYKKKLSLSRLEDDKTIYFLKIYNYLAQSGGTFDYDEETIRLADKFIDMLEEMRIRNKVLFEMKAKIKEHDDLMSEIFLNYHGYTQDIDMYSYYTNLQIEAKEVIGDVIKFGN